ncbi:MAG TPA: T9SS type A sorting domain-containing protein [Flavobacteriales bacterium]|nr:T9SS type A sorting domain-containing protein [Flavobacteriales bacterium]
MITRISTILIICFFVSSAISQNTLFFQNNTGIDYIVQIEQGGNVTMDTNQWSQFIYLETAWNFKDALIDINVDTAISNGDTIDFMINLISGLDTIALKVRFVGVNSTTTCFYSASGDSFSHPWSSDGYFHSQQIIINGVEMTLKYKIEVDVDDGQDNVVFALQENFYYSLDSADFSDPYVINVMAYNIQHMPLITDNFYERGVFLPPLFSPYQDVVIFEELFSDSSRSNFVTPAMLAAGFSYYTTILNDTALTSINTTTNGGVIIYSKWPIELEAEYKYANCYGLLSNASDCLASKGIKYAKINKLGQFYHVFGTHMEAGGGTEDVQVRKEQYGEMRDFISDQGIPTDEAVIFAGDLNTGPTDGLEYDAILDSTNPIIPLHIGYYESTFSYGDTGRIIDHVWGMSDYLLPVSAYNSVFTFRSVDSIMWDIFDFSDHRTVIGRFVYPNIQPDNIDTNLCEGDSLTLNIAANGILNYQWQQNGNLIVGATSNFHNINNPSASSIGVYSCDVINTPIFGGENDVLTQMFYPDGPITYIQSFSYNIATIGFQNPCGVGWQEQIEDKQSFKVVPNINHGRFKLEIKLGLLNAEVYIYNSIGQIVDERIVHDKTIEFNISGLQSGVYWALLKNSKKALVQKFIIY